MRSAINAANAVHPMITVATVPDHHQIRAGGMMATVKIIAYGVPGSRCAGRDAARGALRLAVARYRTASLIITDTPGGPGDKGPDAIAARVTGLGMEMAETVICAHDTARLHRRSRRQMAISCSSSPARPPPTRMIPPRRRCARPAGG